MEPYRDAIDRKDAAARTRAMAAEALRILRRRALRSAAGTAAALGLLSVLAMSLCIMTTQGDLMQAASPGETSAAFMLAQIVLPCAVAWVTLRLKTRQDKDAARWLVEEAGLSGVPWSSIRKTARLARERRTDGLKTLATALLYAPPIAWTLTLPGGSALVFAILIAWGWVPLFFWLASARPLFRDLGGDNLFVASIGPLLWALLFSPLVLGLFGLYGGAALLATGVALPLVLQGIFTKILATEDRSLDAIWAAVVAGQAEEGREELD